MADDQPARLSALTSTAARGTSRSWAPWPSRASSSLRCASWADRMPGVTFGGGLPSPRGVFSPAWHPQRNALAPRPSCGRPAWGKIGSGTSTNCNGSRPCCGKPFLASMRCPRPHARTTRRYAPVLPVWVNCEPCPRSGYPPPFPQLTMPRRTCSHVRPFHRKDPAAPAARLRRADRSDGWRRAAASRSSHSGVR